MTQPLTVQEKLAAKLQDPVDASSLRLPEDYQFPRPVEYVEKDGSFDPLFVLEMTRVIRDFGNSANAVAKATGISQATLSRWVRLEEYRELGLDPYEEERRRKAAHPRKPKVPETTHMAGRKKRKGKLPKGVSVRHVETQELMDSIVVTVREITIPKRHADKVDKIVASLA